MNLFDLMATITLDSSQYEEGLEESEERAESFGSKVGKGLKTAGKIGAAAIGAVTVGAVGLGTAIVKGTNQLSEYGDHIDKQSQKMGISAEAYQEWDAILQHSGTSIDGMQRGLMTLTKKAVDGSDAFNALGLSQEAVASMSQEDLFSATITALQGMEEGSERATLAQELLGTAAKELGPLLNTSAEETEAMRQRVHELGGVMSDDAVKAAAAYQDSLQDMKTALAGAKNMIVGQFLPGITSVMDGLTMVFSGDSGSGIAKINEGISSVVTTITSSLPSILSSGSEIVLGLASAIVDNLPQIAAAAMEIIPQIILSIATALPTLISTGADIIMELLSGIATAVPMLIAEAPAIIESLVTAIIENGPMMILGGIDLLIQLIDGVVAAIPSLIEKAPEIVLSLLNAFIESAPQLLSAGMDLINHVITGVVSLGPMLLSAGKTLITGLWNILTSLAAKFGEIGRNLINNIKNGISVAYIALSAVVSSKFNAIKDTISGIWDNIVTAVSDAVESIKTTVSDTWESIKSTVSDVVSSISTTVSSTWDGITTAVSGAVDSISSTISSTWTSIETTVSSIVNSISSTISSVFESVSSTVSNVWTSIKDTISDAISSAKDTVSSVIDSIVGLFDFSWELPSLKLPHFTVTGSFSLNPPSVPHLSLSWYKKAYDNPFMFDTPTVVSALGFGDGNGAEMVYGHDNLMRDIREAMSQVMPQQIRLYLDGDKLVGGTSERMDSSLGDMQQYQLRWEGA